MKVDGTPFTYRKLNGGVGDLKERIWKYMTKRAYITVEQTDDVGGHYQVTATSNETITKEDVDSWVERAFADRDEENEVFYFDKC